MCEGRGVQVDGKGVAEDALSNGGAPKLRAVPGPEWHLEMWVHVGTPRGCRRGGKRVRSFQWCNPQLGGSARDRDIGT